MGIKYEAGTDVFEPVMAVLLPLKEQVGEEAVQRIASRLIAGLLGLGWGNADGTVGMYDEEPAIVAAFQEHGVLLFCGAEHPDDDEPCDGLARGHEEPHRDHLGRTWADEEGLT